MITKSLRSLNKIKPKSNMLRGSHRWKSECTMLYDGSCPICDREVKVYKKLNLLDNRVEFCDISKLDDHSILDKYGISKSQAMDKLHVLDTDGKMRTGVEGFLTIWQRLPYFNRLLPFFKIPGILTISEWLYLGFSKYRAKIR